MTRSLTTAQQNAVEADTGSTIYLLELTYYDDATQAESVVRLALAGEDIEADPDGTGAVTFTAAGGWLEWGGISESERAKSQGTELALSGVDQAIISPLLTKQFRNRLCRIWRADVDEATGTVDLWDPWVFRQLRGYEVDEGWGDHTTEGTVRITTSVDTPLSVHQAKNAVRTNPTSHNEMLARAGESTGDEGMYNVAGLAGLRIYWGSEGPDRATDGSHRGGSAGTSGGGGGGGGAGQPGRRGRPT